MRNNNNMKDSKLNLLNHDIIALIPAHNEEDNIEELVKKMKGQNIYPVVVVDHSTDRTVEIALKSGAEVIRNEMDKGKGYAIRTGLEHIIRNFNYKCVVLIDGDMQYQPEETKKLTEPILEGRKKVVKGTRNFRKIPFRHALGNNLWRLIYNISYPGVEIKDPCCGFMALSKEVVEKIRLNKIYGGYIVDSSILIEISKNGFNEFIEEVHVTVKYKNKSSIGRGIRMVSGVSLFILFSGIKRNFSGIKRKLKIDN